MISPKQLQSFIAVAEELHFRRAAKRVNLSQPGLSFQISTIEDELQVKLFARNRRKTELTQAGQIFLQEAREVLQRTEQAIATVRRAALGQVETLRIGFISTATAIIAPPLIKRFREQHTHVGIDLRNILTCDQITQLQERKLDVGFLRVPLQLPPEIKARVIHREPFVLLVPATHPLANKRNLRLSDCQKEDFVMYSREMAPGFHDQIMSMLHRNGLTPHVMQEAEEMYTLISLVGTGLGLAIAPASIGRHHADNVAVRKLPHEEARSEIAIVWNTHHVSITTQLFLEMVFEASDVPKKSRAKVS